MKETTAALRKISSCDFSINMTPSELLYVLFVCVSVTAVVFTLVYCLLKDLKFPSEEELEQVKLPRRPGSNKKTD